MRNVNGTSQECRSNEFVGVLQIVACQMSWLHTNDVHLGVLHGEGDSLISSTRNRGIKASSTSIPSDDGPTLLTIVIVYILDEIVNFAAQLCGVIISCLKGSRGM